MYKKLYSKPGLPSAHSRLLLYLFIQSVANSKCPIVSINEAIVEFPRAHVCNGFDWQCHDPLKRKFKSIWFLRADCGCFCCCYQLKFRVSWRQILSGRPRNKWIVNPKILGAAKGLLGFASGRIFVAGLGTYQLIRIIHWFINAWIQLFEPLERSGTFNLKKDWTKNKC